jgi:hypothetical protein
MMKIRDFDNDNVVSSDPLISPDRIIWAVTVHGKIPFSSLAGEPVRYADVYTAVFDAASGDLIRTGVGVDYVK